ncbi:MAG: DNA polymerase III subunit beta [Francisella sp.]
MRIELDKEKFLHILELVGRVSTKHVTLPVLQCVLLCIKKNKLFIKATNLEIGIEAILSIEGNDEEFNVAVPASTLLQFISLIDDVKITIYKEDDVLVVEGKKARTNIKTFAFDEFPNIHKLKDKEQVINSKLFSLGIKTSAFACSQSSIKPELGSVYIFQKKEHSLTFVATDSFRLIEKTVPQKGIILNNEILIPQKNALELSRICDTHEGDPIFQVNENQCALTFKDNLYITSRLTNGSFPDYEQIIPKEFISHVTILKQDLIQAFKRSSIFLNKFQQVSLNINKNNLTISSNNSDIGTTTESIKATTEGEELTLSFNQRYISDCLSHFNDDSIILHFAGIGRPLVITGINDVSTRYLVMPMNRN